MSASSGSAGSTIGVFTIDIANHVGQMMTDTEVGHYGSDFHVGGQMEIVGSFVPNLKSLICRADLCVGLNLAQLVQQLVVSQLVFEK